MTLPAGAGPPNVIPAADIPADDRPLRILVVHAYYARRGGECVVFEAEVQLLRDAGHDVATFVVNNESWVADNRLGAAGRAIWNRQAGHQVAAAVTGHRADVIHVHNTFPSLSSSVYRAASQAGAAVVLTLHNYRSMCVRGVCSLRGQYCDRCLRAGHPGPSLLRACYRNNPAANAIAAAKVWNDRRKRVLQRWVDVAVSPSHYLVSEYRRGNFPLPHVIVKPHFVDIGDSVNPADRSETPAGEPLPLLFVGRMDGEKGVEVLREAWQKLTQQLGPGAVSLRAIGDGPLRRRLEGIDGITVEGYLPSNAVYRAMARAAILIVPSTSGEAFGRVAVEALAVGTPVVGSNVGGQAEVLCRGGGVLFENGSPSALADAIAGLVGDPDRRQRLAVEARAEFEARYTAVANLPQLLAIYHEAIRRRVGGLTVNLPADSDVTTEREADMVDQYRYVGDSPPARSC